MTKNKEYFHFDEIKKKNSKLKLQVAALRKLPPEVLAKAIKSKLQQDDEIIDRQ